MKLCLIWAQDEARGIGYKGKLPWLPIPSDLAKFKALTLGGVVIMGRNTWESLDDAVRPLTGRLNIVVTSNENYNAPGADVATSLEDAFRLANKNIAGFECGGRIWVIGGGRLYEQAIKFADELYVTEVSEVYQADVRAPAIYPTQFVEMSVEVLEGNELGRSVTHFKYVRKQLVFPAIHEGENE